MATNEDINIKVHSEGGERAIGITPEQTERGIGINNESIVVRSVKSYNDLDDKPQINSVELEGNKTASDLGFADVAMSGSYNDLTDTPEIPAAQVNADWNADSGVAEILNKPTIPTKTSQLDNDSGFLTSESDPVFSASAAATITSQDITDWNNKSDFSGSYNDLTDKPTIPTKTSQLANDGANNTSVYVEADELATVATSGSYNDLSNKPTIPAAQVNSDWNAQSGVAQILNKPSLATVATTGSYDDLDDKPTIPTVNDATLTIQRNGTNVQTFTANASSNVTADISVPTKTSDLTNDGSDNTAQYLETDETAYKTASIPSGEVDSTSTATVFTATVPGITELRDGVCMWLNNTAVTSAAGFTININGLGAKPVYSSQSATTAETTMFAKGRTFMFVYDSERVAGGCWVLDRGYNSNDNTIGYQVRTNSQSLPMKSVVYRYRLLFTSADNQHYVPANNSTSTNATASRAVCQDPINPFGRIFYYNTTTSVAANARPGSGNLWEQYAISLGYSFNNTGAALTLTSWKPVYLKCAPQSDGSAIIDSTTPYVQDLPTTEDGKIYIFLGVAYSATNIELQLDHPVYYYKDSQIRLWTNPAATGGGGPTVVQTTGQSTTDVMSQKAVTDELGNKADTSSLATVATTGAYSDLTGTPTIPAAQVNSDWSANSGVAQILNKPNLATVATSGAYSDLTGTPSLAAVATSGAYSDLTGTPSLATVATTGDYDDLINKPAAITVDSALSWTSQNPVENQAVRKTIYVKNSSDDREAGINIAFSDPSLNPYVHIGSKTSATKGSKSIGIGYNAESSAVRSVAIGESATASKREGVALGPDATAGQYSLSIGYHTETVPNYSTAVGPYAKVLTGATNATAIGYQSEASEAETISVGKSTNKRRIVNVADGTTATDAATVGQIPTKTSDLTNDGADNTSTYVEADELATVATSGSYNDLSDTPAIPSYSDFTGATSSVAGAAGLVPAPTTSDPGKYLKGDGTWSAIVPELVEMSYGESNAWAKFIAAYQAKCIVYCRASSNANPGSGSQTRKAFMAYVNNAENPTQVEFQYYRSVSSHTDAQQGDQVFIYLLTSASGGTWSVTTRNSFSKVVAGTNMTSTYSNGQITLNAIQPTAGTITSGSTGYATGGDVYDAIGNVETILQTLNNGGGAQ